MSAGEWGWPGAGSTGEPPNASAVCGGAGPGGVNDFADYSESMRVAFCSGSGPGCDLPTAAERCLPQTGNMFVCPPLGTAVGATAGAGSNRGPPQATSRASAVVAANVLQSQAVADAIGALAIELKRLSGGNLLVLAFYGYTLHCETARVGSNSRNLVNFGHLAGSSLLTNPAIDGFVGTYSYSPNTRDLKMPLLPAGEHSSLFRAGKLWVVEDDTRTHWCKGRSSAMHYYQAEHLLSQTTCCVTVPIHGQINSFEPPRPFLSLHCSELRYDNLVTLYCWLWCPRGGCAATAAAGRRCTAVWRLPVEVVLVAQRHACDPPAKLLQRAGQSSSRHALVR